MESDIREDRLRARFPRLSILFVVVDGIVRHSSHPSGLCTSIEDVCVYPQGRLEMERWANANWYIVGLTNEPRVGLGELSYAEAARIERETYRLCKRTPTPNLLIKKPKRGNRFTPKNESVFTDMLMAPNIPDDPTVAWRMPNPGMIFAGMQNVIRHLKGGVVRLEDCLMVGTESVHAECATRAGIAYMEGEKWRTGQGFEIKNWLNRPSENLKEMRKWKKELGLS